nr:GNAT family N-acetyltransferase [Lysobacter enzymogenes]
MSMFSALVETHWQQAFAGDTTRWREPALTVTIDIRAHARFRAILLETGAGARAMLDPALADALVAAVGASLDPVGLRQALAQAGAPLYGADHLFYFPLRDQAGVLAEPPAAHVRALGPDDAAAFAAFESEASEPDRDDAYVALDHDAAFGAFADGRLVCAASMYRWDESRLMDLGVLTLAGHRGRGHARAVVRAIARHALAQGWEPQYRCQLDNAASVALAVAAGLSGYGRWDVAPSSPQ